MKIEQLSSTSDHERTRVSAKVIWEDYDRPSQELFFETDIEFMDSLWCNPHAFLVGSLMPAMHFGEERVSIDAEICPELREGIATAMGWIRKWCREHGKELSPCRIEARTFSGNSTMNRRGRAGFFYSGGVDSLATLRMNHLNYPLEHPGYIKDGLLVCGFEVADSEKYECVVSSVSTIAKEAGINLIPVHTNLWELGPRDPQEFYLFWVDEFMGAAFSAIAHAFSKRFTSVIINSDYDIPNMRPLSSHPLIDPNFSSNDLSIKHQGITMSRYEKTKLISSWDVALQHLRVCNRSMMYQYGALNCGECEKCVRTMLALVACGALEKSRAFPINDVSDKLVMSAVELTPITVPLYGELLAPLAARGRDDLVRAIKHKMKKLRWRLRIIEPVKKIDRKHLNSALVKLKRRISKKRIF